MAKKLSSVMRQVKAKTPEPKPETGSGGRAGKKAVVAYVEPAVVRQLKVLCAELEITQQDAVIEAMNDWFLKHGKPGIA